jgi:hypothetical protein
MPMLPRLILVQIRHDVTQRADSCCLCLLLFPWLQALESDTKVLAYEAGRKYQVRQQQQQISSTSPQ